MKRTEYKFLPLRAGVFEGTLKYAKRVQDTLSENSQKGWRLVSTVGTYHRMTMFFEKDLG